MAIKVCKFGGTSLAAGSVIRSVKSIIESDKERRFIVVSAPGKRYSGDTKVTDMLYACQSARDREELKKLFAPVRNRFTNIIKELGLSFQIEALLDEAEQQIFLKKQEDFTASRGEYICGMIMAEVLGAKFIDAKDVIFFNADGTLNDEKTYKCVEAALSGVPRAVISGFYGTDADGNIKTFSRGGSDISGAIVARAVNASVYENWTDVSGFLACDPRIVDSPKRVKQISYKEFRELSYMGADLLHCESVFPVCKANIPILIKNTFRPQDEGTAILPTSRYIQSGTTVTGIAGKKNFTIIFIEKANMNSEAGFMCKVLQVLSDENVSIEHIPSGIDTMSLVIESNQLDGKLERVIEGIKKAVLPDTVRVSKDIALIATVGYGMSSSIGTSARLFKAIAVANINIRIIEQGSSEINIIVGVRNEDYENCIRAIYGEFFN